MFSTPVVIEIPEGIFRMGASTDDIEKLAQMNETARKWSAKGRFNREQPNHQVYLPTYRIGKYPVTVGEYRQFIRSGGYQHPEYWTAAGWAWRV